MIANGNTSSAIVVDEVGIHIGRIGAFTVKTTLQPVFRRLDNDLSLAALIGGARFLTAGRDAGTAAIEQFPVDQRGRAAELGRELTVRNRGNAGIEGVPIIVRTSSADREARSIVAACEGSVPFGDAEPARLICELPRSDRRLLGDLTAIAAEYRRSDIGICIGGFEGSPADIEAVRAAGPEVVSIECRWFGRVAAMREAARLLPVLFDSLRAQGALVHIGGLDDKAQYAAAFAAGADLLSGAVLGPPVLAGAAIDRTALSPDQATPISGNVIPLFA